MVKIKRILVDSYSVECDNVIVMQQIKEYLTKRDKWGGFDRSNNKIGLFHTDKVLKGVVNCCMLNGHNFEVEFV